MTNNTRLRVVLFDWHAKGRSQAADDTLFDPLSSFFQFDTISVDWFGRLDLDPVAQASIPTVFFYTPPPFAALQSYHGKVAWIPMWDSVRYHPSDFWHSIPQNVRIVAFADAVASQARAAGLKTLRLQYYSDPDAFPPANWNHERVAFYWNRTGLVSPEFLRRWCAALQVDRLLFKPELDPFIDRRAYYMLPDRLGKTRVEVIPHTERREDYFRLIEPANIFLAPRSHEGIGLTFIEALARGCAVFAYDGATMNEYIRHGETGFLLSSRASLARRIVNRVRNHLAYRGVTIESFPFFHFLNDSQLWQEMQTLDVEALGRRAREAHIHGYATWNQSLPAYAAFLCGE